MDQIEGVSVEVGKSDCRHGDRVQSGDHYDVRKDCGPSDDLRKDVYGGGDDRRMGTCAVSCQSPDDL